ncbi:MAG: response regulator, partial [Candidatus Binatia bacterium]
MDQGKILVVDDEESLRLILKKALESEGFWVQTVENGQLAKVCLHDNTFDVSLVDIRLPDIDGLTLLKEAKKEGLDTSFIVMTAQNTMKNAIEAM